MPNQQRTKYTNKSKKGKIAQKTKHHQQKRKHHIKKTLITNQKTTPRNKTHTQLTKKKKEQVTINKIQKEKARNAK